MEALLIAIRDETPQHLYELVEIDEEVEIGDDEEWEEEEGHDGGGGYEGCVDAVYGCVGDMRGITCHA